MPTKPIAPITTSVASQRDRRYPDTFFDQHRLARFPNGRPWTACREFAANQGHPDGFTTDLAPGDHEHPFESTWDAPFMPEVRWFKYDYRRNRIQIQYPAMRLEDLSMERKYYRAANKMAARSGWPEVPYGSLPREGIAADLGDPPRSPKIADALIAGDLWILGDPNEGVNEELAALLRLTTMGFDDMSMPRRGLVSIDAVIAAPDDKALNALIAAAVASALAARDVEAQAKKEADKARMAKVRAGRKPVPV